TPGGARGRGDDCVLSAAAFGPRPPPSGAFGGPLRIGCELVPLGLTLGERFPGQQVVHVLIAARTHKYGPESRLPDAVALPEFQRRGLEPLEQRRQAAGYAMVDAKLVDHGRLSSGT